MPDLNTIHLFRITHIENIPHILQHGITHSTSIHVNPLFKSIGDKDLISNRKNVTLSNGKQLGEYIPFYFGVRMPMLYVIQKGFNGVEQISAENIVYCVSSVQKMIDLNLDFIFTDGHANSKLTEQYTIEDIQEINTKLDIEAIKDNHWHDKKDSDKKRRKEAEFLVLGDIPIEAILGYITYNEIAKNKVINHGAKAEKVLIKLAYYF